MDQDQLNDLIRILYGDLHRIAVRHVRSERPDHTLEATGLLHEAYLKLSDSDQSQFTSRTHFLAVASRVMRQVLVDYARARQTEKRGGGEIRSLEENEDSRTLEMRAGPTSEPVEVLNLHRALEALAAENHELAELIELRYFGGMTAEEIAETRSRSVHVIRHDLRLAHAWLRRHLATGNLQ
jgi:RNA polymerase sigma factor (TIGR02999 family)